MSTSTHARFYTRPASHPQAGQVVHGFIEVDADGEPVHDDAILTVQGSPAEIEAKCRAILADPTISDWLRTSAGCVLNELGIYNWTM